MFFYFFESVTNEGYWKVEPFGVLSWGLHLTACWGNNLHNSGTLPRIRLLSQIICTDGLGRLVDGKHPECVRLYRHNH